LIVRVANLGGRAQEIAESRKHRVTKEPPHDVPTRYGGVSAQFYRPDTDTDRTVLLMPGIHSFGIREPRLMDLADDLAATGVLVMTMALPDLTQYQITPRSTDVIEDGIKWMADQPSLAPDGKVGVIGISFAGGLSIVAAGREPVREKVAFVVSFGGHGDLQRTMKYLVTGEAPQVPGLTINPPHDYGVAVLTYAAADRLVPPDQVQLLRDGVSTFLYASQLTLVSMDEANQTFEKARAMEKALPEPSATLLKYVNERNVKQLGPILLPHIEKETPNAAASAVATDKLPTAPVYLLHGDGDTVIPTAESALLGDYLRSKGVDVQVLLSGLITHAEVDRGAARSEAWKLVSFWADVLRQ
jgi:dienelactone hydrolase